MVMESIVAQPYDPITCLIQENTTTLQLVHFEKYDYDRHLSAPTDIFVQQLETSVQKWTYLLEHVKEAEVMKVAITVYMCNIARIKQKKPSFC